MREQDGKVIVFGTGVVAYGVIEEAVRAGYHVIHVTTKPGDVAAATKLARERHVVEYAGLEDERLLDFFREGAGRWSGALLLPVNDLYARFTSRHFDALGRHYHCATQPWEIHEAIINKNRLYRTAHELGVPAPAVHEVRTEADLDAAIERIGFPCLVKPFQTPEFFSIFGTKMFEVQDEPTLRAKFARVLASRQEVMLSEIIPGEVAGLATYISCLDAHGNPVLEAFTRKVRENVDYGVASVIGTVGPIDEIRETSLRLLRHFGYRGYSAPEWKRDARDGVYKLIEINTRPIVYHRLLHKAGVNAVDTLYRDIVQGQSQRPVLANSGISWMHPVSEIYALRKWHRNREIPFAEFRQPYRQPYLFALPFFRDPRPAWRLLRREVSGFFRRRFAGS